jgi:membrane protein required for colicin V production
VLTADAIILGLVMFFAVWGSITGAARQLGQLGAIAAAYVALRVLLPFVSPIVASAMGVSGVTAKLVSGALIFVATVFLVRMALTRMLEHVLVGKDAKTRAPDRWLGFLLGGLKAAAASYVVLSGVVYAQENFALGKRRLELVSRKSWAYQWVKEHNTFDPKGALFKPRSETSPP